MKHKLARQGFVAGAALLMSSSQAFSQESRTIIDLSKNSDILQLAETSRGELGSFDVHPSSPNEPQIIAVGEFPWMPGCPLPPGGRPPQPAPPGGPPMHGFSMPMPPMPALDLTDDQVSKLAKSHREFKATSCAAFVALHFLESEMQDKLSADSLNESDVKRLAEEIALQKAELSRKMSAHLLEFSKVLTAEQRRKMRLGKERMEIGPLGGAGPMLGGAMPLLRPPGPPPIK